MSENAENAERTENADLAEIANGSNQTELELLREKLETYGESAVETVAAIMQSGAKEENRLKAANEVLDRLGLTKEQRISVTHKSVNPKTITAALQGVFRMAGEPAEDVDFKQIEEATSEQSNPETQNKPRENAEEKPDPGLPSDFLEGLSG